MRYVPASVPEGITRELQQFLREELRRIQVTIANIDNLKLEPLAAEPEKYANGMIVYADGSNWNPGSGAGFYGREAGAWVKL